MRIPGWLASATLGMLSAMQGSMPICATAARVLGEMPEADRMPFLEHRDREYRLAGNLQMLREFNIYRVEYLKPPPPIRA
jgi:hypothetical protein